VVKETNGANCATAESVQTYINKQNWKISRLIDKIYQHVSLLDSQSTPVYPWAHEHKYELSTGRHIPPFWQGWTLHASSSAQQKGHSELTQTVTTWHKDIDICPTNFSSGTKKVTGLPYFILFCWEIWTAIWSVTVIVRCAERVLQTHSHLFQKLRNFYCDHFDSTLHVKCKRKTNSANKRYLCHTSLTGFTRNGPRFSGGPLRKIFRHYYQLLFLALHFFHWSIDKDVRNLYS